MPYSLRRHSDGAGDSGQMSRRLWPDGHKDMDPRPIVGAGIAVGSVYARTYSVQDWWQTTEVTEIISETELPEDVTEIVFRTRNSVYTWRHF